MRVRRRPATLYLPSLLCVLHHHQEHDKHLPAIFPNSHDKCMYQMGEAAPWRVQRYPSPATKQRWARNYSVAQKHGGCPWVCKPFIWGWGWFQGHDWKGFGELSIVWRLDVNSIRRFRTSLFSYHLTFFFSFSFSFLDFRASRAKLPKLFLGILCWACSPIDYVRQAGLVAIPLHCSLVALLP